MVDVNQVLIHCMHMTNATTITSLDQLNASKPTIISADTKVEID